MITGLLREKVLEKLTNPNETLTILSLRECYLLSLARVLKNDMLNDFVNNYIKFKCSIDGKGRNDVKEILPYVQPKTPLIPMESRELASSIVEKVKAKIKG